MQEAVMAKMKNTFHPSCAKGQNEAGIRAT